MGYKYKQSRLNYIFRTTLWCRLSLLYILYFWSHWSSWAESKPRNIVLSHPRRLQLQLNWISSSKLSANRFLIRTPEDRHVGQTVTLVEHKSQMECPFAHWNMWALGIWKQTGHSLLEVDGLSPCWWFASMLGWIGTEFVSI